MSDVQTHAQRTEAERLILGVSEWAKAISPEQAQREEYRRALIAFDTALAATIKYIKELRDRTGKQDGTKEDKIASLWCTAGEAVGPFNKDLSGACVMKGLGWIDRAAWDRARARGVKIGIPEMEEARMQLELKRGVPGWFPVAGVAFTAITIVFLMYMLIAGPPIEVQKKVIFDVLVAICVAASAAFLGGTAVASGKIPFFRNAPIEFSSVGGVAIFIVVLLLMHFGT